MRDLMAMDDETLRRLLLTRWRQLQAAQREFKRVHAESLKRGAKINEGKAMGK